MQSLVSLTRSSASIVGTSISASQSARNSIAWSIGTFGYSVSTSKDTMTSLVFRRMSLILSINSAELRTARSPNNALSPFLANVFLRRFERELSVDKRFPRVWHRYVDDVFAVINRRHLSSTLELLNTSRFPSIKFTAEEEVSGSLNFLDLTVTRRDDKSVKFTIYWKPSWTGRWNWCFRNMLCQINKL